MTEPEVASSDATNIETRMVRDGDEYVINGRKWYTSGAMNPDAKIFIVMGKTDPNADRHQQQSQILVPRDTPGVTVVRGMQVYGYDDNDHGGHAEVLFEDVRVPVDNIIGGEGQGFAIAQARLGPGRIHHCMRAIGVAELAIEMMCARADERVAFGRKIADQGVVRDWIAQSRVQVEQLRLLVLKTAWLMDTVGQQGRPHRDPGDQDRHARGSPSGSSTRPSRCTAPAASPRTSSSPTRPPSCGPCGSRTARTRCTSTPSPATSSSASGPSRGE